MKTKKLLSALILCATALSAEAGSWQSLFDGESLDGWIQRGGEARYAIQDGSIVGVTVSDTPNSFLCTSQEFGDFILELEVKQEEPSNSGIQFRSLSLADHMDGRVHGYQCEIDPSRRAWTGGIYDEARRGWLARPDENPAAKGAYQFGRWNHVRIEAIGDSLRTWINGIAVSHVVDDATAKGFIALQVHSIGSNATPGSKILWRDIRIQTEDLTPAPIEPGLLVRNWIPNTISEAEAAQGWQLLWDGKTSQGWRRAGSNGFPDKGWRIQAGELIVQAAAGDAGSTGGDIVTEKEFSAFELQLDFFMTEGANSGIKYFVAEQLATGDKNGSALGLEYQILDDERHPDAKFGAAGNRTLSSLYDLIPAKKVVSTVKVPRGPSQWHHARIVAKPDGSVEHWLNGCQVVDFDRQAPLFDALIARSKYADIEGFGKSESGPILLQDHGNEVHFRSIKLRPLQD